MLTIRQSFFILLATMSMIVASAYIVERFFPSHARGDPPLALKPSDLNGGNDCS